MKKGEKVNGNDYIHIEQKNLIFYATVSFRLKKTEILLFKVKSKINTRYLVKTKVFLKKC